MIRVIRPILFAFLQSRAVKVLLVDLLKALVKETDNTLDDAAVLAVEQALLK